MAYRYRNIRAIERLRLLAFVMGALQQLCYLPQFIPVNHRIRIFIGRQSALGEILDA